MIKEKEIRAVFDDDTITVYQAYNSTIAIAATAAQTLAVTGFKQERMTWVKPSFLWMMYRCGWAAKENQEHVLAVKIKRTGFEWALSNACLSHFEKDMYGTHDDWKDKLQSSPVRIQWDPEKNIYLQPLPYKSIQIGLTGIAVEKYLSEWIVQIEDITEQCRNISSLIANRQMDEANHLLPQEQLYSLPENIKPLISHS